MTAAYFEDHPTDPDKVILRKPSMKVEGPLHVVCQCDKCKAQLEQEPVAWKIVPIKPTDEMLKAMDECSTEGYDERLYAGHAASVYMAAVDVAPTPPQRKPLTDAQSERLYRNIEPPRQQDARSLAAFKRLLRVIEAAHGIKGEA